MHAHLPQLSFPQDSYFCIFPSEICESQAVKRSVCPQRRRIKHKFCMVVVPEQLYCCSHKRLKRELRSLPHNHSNNSNSNQQHTHINKVDVRRTLHSTHFYISCALFSFFINCHKWKCRSWLLTSVRVSICRFFWPCLLEIDFLPHSFTTRLSSLLLFLNGYFGSKPMI